MVSVKAVNIFLTLTSFVGLGLSIYSYAIELVAEADEKYVAMCDISENMSCTKAFKSRYGKGFGIVGLFLGEGSILNKPNSLLGVFFYSLSLLLAQSNSSIITRAAFMGSVLSSASSIYLAFILYYVLYNFCVVCVSIYAVNFISLGLNYCKLTLLKTSSKKVDIKKKIN